ncbi:SCO family protein [Noviherbaspirillum aerium]|uniref:SCO family protein n=1 Tax=Noviherbaspirillum aerium TaxID=2588497 RepID=UPI001CEFA307|nr:SCO family protein [Noviherbaspirillum aerium]
MQTAVASSAAIANLAVAKQGNARPSSEESGYFPNLVLETHEGKRVRFYDDLVKGKMVVFNMMYANCSNICPPNTANLLQVQQALGAKAGRDVFMYSITLQPEFDSAAALQDYMRKYGIKSGWTFLTGQRKDIDLIRRKLGFFDPDPVIDADLRQHTGMLRIGHDGRDRWSMLPALASPRQILNSISNYL